MDRPPESREPLRSELLREVNDRIREVGEPSQAPEEGLEFLCECGGPGCVEMVMLSASEYDGIRLATRSVLAVAHDHARV
jgi:hypothetical protein